MAEKTAMDSILRRQNSSNLTEVFEKEKITPDVVPLLSASETKQLGVSNSSDMMSLRMECSIHGKRKPQRNRLGSGAPEFNIPKSILENHLEEGFKIKEIASMLSVSESTNYRRMQSYRLGSQDFSDVSDEELHHHISELSKDFPFCGEGMLKFLLQERGIKVQRMQPRELLRDYGGMSTRVFLHFTTSYSTSWRMRGYWTHWMMFIWLLSIMFTGQNSREVRHLEQSLVTAQNANYVVVTNKNLDSRSTSKPSRNRIAK